MSTDASPSKTAGGMKFASDLREAYSQFQMATGRYILIVLIPATIFFALTIAAGVLAPFPIGVRAPIPLLGFVALIAAVAFPKVQVDARSKQIENRFHILMTHMTVLATTNIDRMEVFRELAQEEEYGEAAKEIGRLVQLVDNWNQSLDEACRRRAKAVPSDAIADFFERLGYTLSAGQALDDFLLSEQHYIIEQYETIYESALANLEVMKDLYLSMILSMTFALVFAVVLPILIGTDPTLMVAAVIVMFVFVQTGFFLGIRSMSPSDPIWYYPAERTAADRKLLIWGTGAWIVTIGLSTLTVLGAFGIGPGIEVLLFFLDPVPAPLGVAVSVTPLLAIGLVVRQREGQIVRRDEEFPSFIRGLGSSESAKQSPTSVVLSTLREKDFGSLTPAIERLYRRLNARLDSRVAWEAFAIDSRSYLIQKFSEMYVTGRQMGGDPKQLGELISTNMNTINQLREQRRQSAVTLIGLLYGITAAASFAFFVGIEIVVILADMSEQFAVDDLDFARLIHADAYNVPLIEWSLLGVVVINAALSSVMIRTVDGGRYASGYTHFVGLTWVGCLTAILTGWMAGTILTV